MGRLASGGRRKSLMSAAVAGMGIALLGLAYHHARRDCEWSWERE